VSNRHGRHGEANENRGTAPDPSSAVPGFGDTSRALPVDVRAVRLRRASGTDLGRLRLVDGEVLMTMEAARFLSGLTVILPEFGRVKPEDGERYLRGVLASFAGTMLWAEVDE
jgi:hypothetical protein